MSAVTRTKGGLAGKPEEARVTEEFLSALREGLLLALQEREILTQTQYRRAEAARKRDAANPAEGIP